MLGYLINYELAALSSGVILYFRIKRGNSYWVTEVLLHFGLEMGWFCCILSA